MKLLPQWPGPPLGPVLAKELGASELKEVDIVVAWVRASGLYHLQTELLAFLESGGAIRLVTGVDGGNTSRDALHALMELASKAKPNKARLFVRHNEAGPIFHPKIYSFRGADTVRSFVGSNNFTQAGLFQNEEFSVALDWPIGSPADESFRKYVDSLLDEASGLTKPLTPELLSDLVARGYVASEAALRAAAQRSRKKQKTGHSPLFGSKGVSAPNRKASKQDVVAAQPAPVTKVSGPEDWHAVYLRLRLARGTQAQIPILVAQEIRRRMGLAPLNGPIEITHRLDGVVHVISPAMARGQVNTYKFEAQQTKGEPLLHVYVVGKKLFYEFLDSANPLGAELLGVLEEGFKDEPPTTVASRGDAATSTWYRFVG